jgi:hypothetical protein
MFELARLLVLLRTRLREIRRAASHVKNLSPDADESTPAAIGGVIAERVDSAGATAYPLHIDVADPRRPAG